VEKCALKSKRWNPHIRVLFTKNALKLYLAPCAWAQAKDRVIFILFCVLLDRLDVCLVFQFGEGEGEEIPSQADIL